MDQSQRRVAQPSDTDPRCSVERGSAPSKPCPPSVQHQDGKDLDAGHDRARGGHPQALAHAAAINVATGRVRGDKTAQVGPGGFAALPGWARELDGQRVWASEDCRHVSGALERFFLDRGERVVRVSTPPMAAARAALAAARQAPGSVDIGAANAEARAVAAALPPRTTGRSRTAARAGPPRSRESASGCRDAGRARTTRCQAAVHEGKTLPRRRRPSTVGPATASPCYERSR
jgi:hypothetical protein